MAALSVGPLAVSVRAVEAVPEPGLIVYGQIYSLSAPSQTVAITAVTWNSSIGGDTAVTTSNYGASLPEKIPSDSTGSYYIARIPYETADSLNPVGTAIPGLTLVGGSLFDLTASTSTTHSFGLRITPQGVSTGKNATIKSINGVDQPANTAAYSWSDITTNPTAPKRGGIVRVDWLVDSPASDAFSVWMAGFLPNGGPNAARAADADGDGMTNEQEYAANTSPVDPADLLRILSITAPGGNTATLSWASKSGLTYTVEYSNGLTGEWVSHNTYPGATGQTTAPNLPMTTAQPRRFWRVRVTR